MRNTNHFDEVKYEMETLCAYLEEQGEKGLTAWEVEFLISIDGKEFITERQASTIQRIYNKLHINGKV